TSRKRVTLKDIKMTEQKPILPCMGNPLLDICVVDDETLLKK
ncbi:7139_t:CDS:1, partial [Gigaspora rosea]